MRDAVASILDLVDHGIPIESVIATLSTGLSAESALYMLQSIAVPGLDRKTVLA